MTTDAVAGEELLMLALDDLMPDPNQPRRTFGPGLASLASSIADHGVLQPLRVLFDDERKKFRIIVGESRFHASKMAGLTHLPCLPIQGEPTDADILAFQIVENTARADLLPTEFAAVLAKYKALTNKTGQEVAADLGLSSGTVSRSLALMSLPPAILARIDDGRISADCGYHLSRLLPDEASLFELAEAVAERRIGRDGIAQAVQAALGKRNVKPARARLPVRAEGGVTLTFASDLPLTWDAVNAALEFVRKQARKLVEGGSDVSELAKPHPPR